MARDHFERMKNGAIQCNSGHFNVKLDLVPLGRISAALPIFGPQSPR